MIANLPTSEGFDRVARRLHFQAWSSLLAMLVEFQRQYDEFSIARPPQQGDEWHDEWNDYLGACQPDLHSTVALVQQSNELSLKARLTAVSPYLLLVGTMPKLSSANSDLDFSELRTLDSVDLPGAVNTFTSRPLSPKFVQSYNDLRVIRNKVVHAGAVEDKFTPQSLMALMVETYLELWPEGTWLADWLQVETESRYSVFHDFRNASPYSDVLAQWPYAVEMLGKGQFQRLFGHAKSRRRYHCPSCTELASTRWSDAWELGMGTAFLNDAKSSVHCAMCSANWSIGLAKCSACGHHAVCNAEGDHLDRCLYCGNQENVGA